MTSVEEPGFCTLCRSRCGTLNVVEDGRLVRVRPEPSHPTGQALCVKGRAGPEIAHDARRLAYPLRRTAPKGAADPGWQRITWDEALNETASRLSQLRDAHGAEAVAFLVTSPSASSLSDSIDWVFRLIRRFGSPDTAYATEICNWQKDHAHAFTYGCGMPTPDYASADLVLLGGHNPANSWLAQANAIGAARARGARLAVIDPRLSGAAGCGPLLACAESAGLALPGGCRVGQCENCAVTVLSGQVSHVGPVADLGEGLCLTCQSVPVSDVVLDI